MDEKIKISGFADEISQDFEKQLQVVTELGMKYISLRSAYGKSINEYTVEEVQEKLLPLLQKYNVEVSSIGSSIGKIEITDEAGFTRQLLQLQELCKICKILSCRYIRMFSFFIPEGEKPEQYKKQVVSGMKKFTEVAKDADIVLLHENEKEIYGDTGKRCLELLEEVNSPNFKAAFDFANFVQCEQNTVNCWEMLKPYIVYIHIKDALYENQINVLFGTGDGRCEQLLRQGICREGYEGFLTLEPHLVQFEALASLERGKADVIRKNLAKDGEKGYRMQYQALSDMLKKIEKPERKIRFGIIGVGSQGNAYASLLTGKGDTAEIRVPHAPEHAGVGALCDNDPQREAFCRKKW